MPEPDYPQHWEADVVLSDGGVVHLRPVRSDDREALRAMHSRMSSRSLYLRYFTAVAEVGDRILDTYVEVDHHDSVTLVAELGDEIIAAGSYHFDAKRQAAEVAFSVQDADQGRGLGSILLEHLAAAAQECGIRRFTAEVLAENPAMVRVFIDAGYQVAREYSSGVVDLEFDIAPTDRSRAVLVSREHRAESRSIARLLTPRSIAVIGASNESTKLGHAVLANLLAGPFTGPVYPVNPEAVAVQGVRAYREVTEIPGEVDVAVVTVPAATVAEVVEGCRLKGVHGLVVVTAGFADAGAGGADAQRTMVSVARANGMRVLGPNCLGMVNTDPAVRMNATLAPRVPPPGRVGFFCQSGALGIAVLADAATRGLGLSSFVSAGNRADVSGNDLLQFWQSDARTEVVLLYLESFGNPRKFARLARTLARSKPVIAVKSGRHALVTPGLAASSSALSPAAVDTVFAQSGVIRTDTLGQAFDVAQLLATQPLPVGETVAVVGNSTALGVLAMDACLDAGLTVAGDGPRDLGVNVSPDELAGAVRAASADPQVGAVVVVYVPPVAIQGDQHAIALREAAVQSRVPVVSTFLAVDGLVDQLTVPSGDGGAARGSVPSYRTPERAVAALALAARYARWRQRPAGTLIRADDIDKGAARALVEAWPATDGPAREVTDDELAALLAAYGIELAAFRVADGVDEVLAAAAELGYPVTLKTFDRQTRESLLGGGVRPSLQTEAQVRAAYEVLSSLGAPRIYVQRMAQPEKSGVSTVFGLGADPSFGALVSFGISGVATDLLDDHGYRAVPLTDLDAADLIDAPRAAPLLDGYGGRTPVRREALEDLALRLSALADDVPELAQLQIRVLAGPAGCTVIGATATAGPPPARPDERRRMR
ncbi:bifunctional acetate--CoA ligase family protein/GNAT family N-acetyltransferase [Nakamurella lactea]|uniref:bifunctional acetate--CoA ligase family protein/GNAT family N-acetyltransferase n=1 Tax=Nakamurella lactea TaxID=459515 RepID=UPI00041ACDE8|nr:bifunctional GNAT family N-acetyltransferase/acetate--CoA ligase family protein [Nakamurella lactea]